MLSKWNKLLAPVLGFAVLILSTEFGADSKWVTYALALGVVVGVYKAPKNT